MNMISEKGLKILEQIRSQINKDTLRPAIKVVILMLVITGIVYPVVLVVIGQSTLPYQSNGSLVTSNGKVIGSKLIAQDFKSPKFFHPRPSSDSAIWWHLLLTMSMYWKLTWT